MSLSLANVPVSYNNYKYRCNVTAACPPGVTSAVVTLNVGSTPPAITTHPSSVALSISYTASFSISSPGYGATYQWQQSPDGTTWSDITSSGTGPVFSGFTADTLNLSSVPPSYNNYKFRCIASNSCGASATSNVATLTISVPTLSTTAASGIQFTQATSGGNITSNGGAAVTARGVCWSASPNPTIADSYTTDGTGTGTFTSTITGLTPGVTYYVRAYATNGIGTAYGNEISFSTIASCAATVNDYDGNTYNIIGIGGQCWMKENLKSTHYSDGIAMLDGTSAGDITGNYTSKYFFDYDNNPANTAIYGKLYTWAAVMNGAASSAANPSGVQGVCPIGWHIPSDAEWTSLENYLMANDYNYDGTTTGNKYAKSLASTTGWTSSTNTGAVGNTDYPSYRNKSSFSVLPGGYRNAYGTFNSVGYDDILWSSTEFNSTTAWDRALDYNFASVFRDNGPKAGGFSVRCLRD